MRPQRQAAATSSSLFQEDIVGGEPAFVNITSNTRIIGGKPVTTRSQYPYYGFTQTGALCGATLVAPDMLVTAAHCQSQFRRAGVFLGGVLLSGADAVETWEIDREYVHPNFDADTLENDIMLVRIKQKQPGSGGSGVSRITPVAYNQFAYTPANRQSVTAIGFGSTSEGGSLSRDLQQVPLKVNPHRNCARQYNRLNERVVKRVMICAGTTGRDACQGDSGGPLLRIDNNNNNNPGTTNSTLVGIVSWGVGCGRAQGGVYTRISAFADWISDTICAQSNAKPDSCPRPSPNNNNSSSSTGAPPCPLRMLCLRDDYSIGYSMRLQSSTGGSACLQQCVGRLWEQWEALNFECGRC